MNNEHFYDVDLKWEGDRKGTLSSPVLDTTLEVATPIEFPKGMPGIWSPEHLLVAAVSSCLLTTFLAIAENFKLEFSSINIGAKGKMEKPEGHYLITEITLSPTLVIINEADLEKAQKVLEKSEKACLISNSIKSKIILEPKISVALSPVG